MAGQVTVCALFYGDHAALAQRCLGSLEKSFQEGKKHIADIRLGLNAVCPGVRDYVHGWAEDIAIQCGIPVTVYQPERNVFKYPLMRAMFHQPLPTRELGDYVMWFDDDAYLEEKFSWARAMNHMEAHDMIGHVYYWYIRGQQWAWVQQQPWYNPAVGPPKIFRGKPVFQFAQGSWWVIRSSILRKYDWPIKALRHNGGDSMLGELFRQQRLRLGRFVERVRVNADERGRDSRAPRRGFREPPLGQNLAESLRVDPAYHQFIMAVRSYTAQGWSNTTLSGAA